MSGWGFRAVEGVRQRDRSPGPAEGQHGGLRGLESPARPDAMEGDVAGSLPLERGPPPWTVKWQPLLGAPWLKAEADRCWETLDPRHLLVLSGTHLPHCVQLHLHSHLCGRDDTEGTWLHLGPLLPLAQPRSARHSPAPQQHSTDGLGGSPPLGPSHWVGLLGLGKAGCGQLRARCPGAHNPFPVSWRYLLEVQGTAVGFYLGCFPEPMASNWVNQMCGEKGMGCFREWLPG